MPEVKSPRTTCLILGVDRNLEKKTSLKELGEFLGLSIINYRGDLGKSEEYTLIRSDGKRAQLNTEESKLNSKVFK